MKTKHTLLITLLLASQALAHTTPSPLETLFNRLDRNGDGFIERSEVGGMTPPTTTNRPRGGGTGDLVMREEPPHKQHVNLRYDEIEGVDPNLLSLDLYVPDDKQAYAQRPVMIMIYAGDRMNLGVLAPAFAEVLTKADSPSRALDTVTLDHGQINSHIGMIDEPMTVLIMRLHAGEDASRFPAKLDGKSAASTTPATPSAKKPAYAKPDSGVQILPKDKPDGPWFVEKPCGPDSLRVDNFCEATFTQDKDGARRASSVTPFIANLQADDASGATSIGSRPTVAWSASVAGQSHTVKRRLPVRSGNGHMQLPRVMRGVGAAPDGCTYASGSFLGTVQLGGVELTSAGGPDIMLAAFDQAGQVKWFKRFGGAGADNVFDRSGTMRPFAHQETS